MTCTELDDRLLDFVEGELPQPEAEQVRSHVRGCPSCDAKLRDYKQMFGALSAARSIDNRAQRPEIDSDATTTSGTHRGRKRIGDFEIMGELGRGGMGVVYRAKQLSLHRVVALKILASGAVQSERAIRRFQHEAQAAARLHHTNIVPIYAQGEADGCYYYAMELVEGPSLSQVLRENPDLIEGPPSPSQPRMPTLAPRTNSSEKTLQLGSIHMDVSAPTFAPSSAPAPAKPSVTTSQYRKSGAFPRPRVEARKYKRIARWFAEVADGLAHAHAQGIVHRDIKPQNLLLGPDDKLHITDFGLARLLDEPGVTLTSEIIGTPAYMSPEQITAGRTGVDHRSDIYSLGVTLYEVLTGQRPFNGATYERVVHQVVNQEPSPTRRISPHIPLDLDTICMRCLEKQPAARFATAAEMAADLRRYADDYPIQSRRIGPAAKAIRWVRRNRALTAAIVCVVLVAGLSPLLWHFVQSNANQHIDRAAALLLEDYRARDRALSELAQAGWFGDSRRKLLVRSLANIVRDAESVRADLEDWLRKHPNDLEAMYLLTWACMRLEQSAGADHLSLALQHMKSADARLKSASAAAYFYRGMALIAIDPRAARDSLQSAIDNYRSSDRQDERAPVFTQAKLQRARALNWLMYALRDPSMYGDAEATLGSLIELDFFPDYARYLLATAMRIQAEIVSAQARASADPIAAAKGIEHSDKLYEGAITLADQALDPGNSQSGNSEYGYKALANVYESLGDWHAAAHAWESIPQPLLDASKDLTQERDAYLMRLHAWLGDDSRALKVAERLVNSDPTDIGYAIALALLRKATGDSVGCEKALNAVLPEALANAQNYLSVRAGFQLCQMEIPHPIRSVQLDPSRPLPPWWDAEWANCLFGFLRGEVSWSTLLETAGRSDHPPIPTLRMQSASWYFKAAQEIAEGRHDLALHSFQTSANLRDGENWCFWAQLWSEKMAQYPRWPHDPSSTRKLSSK